MCIPKCMPDTKEMHFRSFQDESDLEVVYFGLQETDRAQKRADGARKTSISSLCREFAMTGQDTESAMEAAIMTDIWPVSQKIPHRWLSSAK